MSQRHGRSSRKAEGPATQPAANKKTRRGRDKISAKARAADSDRALNRRGEEPSDDQGASSSDESEGEQARPAKRRRGQAGAVPLTTAQFQEILGTIEAQTKSGQQALTDKGLAAIMEVVKRPATKNPDKPGTKGVVVLRELGSLRSRWLKLLQPPRFSSVIAWCRLGPRGSTSQFLTQLRATA
jgi:hypothetical protein